MHWAVALTNHVKCSKVLQAVYFNKLYITDIQTVDSNAFQVYMLSETLQFQDPKVPFLQHFQLFVSM